MINSEFISVNEFFVKQLLQNVKFVVFDFDGVFTDNMVITGQDGHESVRCSRSDGYGLMRLRKRGIDTLVLSSEKNPVVAARCKKLGIKCQQGFEEKLGQFKSEIASRNLSANQVAYVGNDINDIDCLKFAGVPITVFDAMKEVLPYGLIRTVHGGGKGAVREVCDVIERSHL